MLRYSMFNILRSSSIVGHLQLQYLSILIWSPRVKFKSSERSNTVLRRYSTLNISRSSSNGGRLHFNFQWLLRNFNFQHKWWECAEGYATCAAGYAKCAEGYDTYMCSRLCLFSQIIIPLRGPSCKLRYSIFSNLAHC